MTIEIVGDIVLTSEYWDCECDEDYIHARSEKKCCVCGAFRSDQPFAHLSEVETIGFPLKSRKSQVSKH